VWTYEFTGATLVVDLDSRLTGLVDDVKRPVSHISFQFIGLHLSTDETFGIKDSIFGIRVESILGRVSNTGEIMSREGKWMKYGNIQLFILSEANPQRRYLVTLGHWR